MISSQRWQQFSIFQQMSHIGSEVSRARVWQQKNDLTSCRNALVRAFELVDLSIEDERWKSHLKEICRFRELLADQYVAGHVYQVSLNDLEEYCMGFALVSKKN